MRKASKLLCLRAFYESAGLFLFAPSGARGTAKTPSWGREIFPSGKIFVTKQNGKASKLLCLRAFYESAGLFLFAPSGARGTAKTPSWGREIFLAYRLPAYARNGNFFQNRIKAEAVQLL